MKTLSILALAAGLGLAAGAASAATVDFTFDPGDSSVTNNVSNLSTTIVNTPVAFSLGTGDLFSFDAVQFTADGWGIWGSGSITANLAFNPPGATATVPGSASGVTTTLWGTLYNGVASFSTVDFTDGLGSTFSIALSSVNFSNCGGLHQPKCISKATVTGVDVIPLPAAGWLLLGGLAGLGGLAARKRKKAT